MACNLGTRSFVWIWLISVSLSHIGQFLEKAWWFSPQWHHLTSVLVHLSLLCLWLLHLAHFAIASLHLFTVCPYSTLSLPKTSILFPGNLFSFAGDKYTRPSLLEHSALRFNWSIKQTTYTCSGLKGCPYESLLTGTSYLVPWHMRRPYLHCHGRVFSSLASLKNFSLPNMNNTNIEK